MNLFINGGGSSDKAYEAYLKFSSLLDKNKQLLYIPLAMDEEYESYDECFKWINEELNKFEITNIHMVRSFEELVGIDYNAYSGIFIGGGNTFKLLKGLKESGAFLDIKNYLENGGCVFGGSAGAIIFGKDLFACKLDDYNDVNLLDTDGFNFLFDYSILCHYTNRDSEHDLTNTRYLTNISETRKCVALPEEVTLYVNDDDIQVIGDKPFYVFEDGIRSLGGKTSFKKFNNNGKRDILIICDFPNIDLIKDIQAKYYDLADKIPPHIAVTFPFETDMSDEDLYYKLKDVLKTYKPFKIICRGVSSPRGENNYKFLNIVLNKDIIKSISDDIYNSIIPSELEYRDKYNYDPHISLVNKVCDEDIILDDFFEMDVKSLYVERIGSNDESIKLFDVYL